MSDGKTHAAITVATSGVLAVSMWRAGFSSEEIRLVAAGCVSGVILSPDLDVDAGFIGFKTVDKYFGKIVGTAWRLLWWPYAALMPHRSALSHAPIISTTLRLLYWYAIYVVACILFRWPIWVPDLIHGGYLYLGLLVSDVMHYFTDIISTSLKRRRNAGLHFPMSEMRRGRRDRA